MTDDISLRDGPTLAEIAEMQWREAHDEPPKQRGEHHPCPLCDAPDSRIARIHVEAQEAHAMGTTVTIERKPDGVVVIGSGLRPAGHRLGFSFAFTPDDPTVPGKNTGTSAIVRNDGTCKVVSDTFELTMQDAGEDPTVPAGTVAWWWHDGEDFDEPALTEDGGSGEFRVP